MSLLKYTLEECQFMDKVTVPDGYGGFTRRWVPGAKFDANITKEESTEALTAQAMGVTALYQITTTRGINLQYHEVVKRLRDGKIFRVTTDGDDMATPSVATLDMRVVRAEEWELTDE